MLINSNTYSVSFSGKAEIHNSMLIALLLSFNMMNAVIDSYMKIDIPVGNLVGAVIFFLFLFTTLMNKDFAISLQSFFLINFILIIILFSLPILSFYIGTVNVFINFIFYGLLAYLIGSKKINMQLVTRYTIYISIGSIFAFFDLMEIYGKSTTFNRIDMGLSYAILPIVLAAVIHFIYYRKDANVFIWIGYVFNAYCLYILLFEGSRGVMVSLVIFFWFLSLNKYIIKKDNKSFHKQRKKWFYFSSIIIIFVLTFFEKIIVIFYENLSSLGIKIAFIEKNYLLIQSEGDISNNRIYLYQKAFKGIMESPLWGNGIGSFQYYTGEIYPHNLILELLYEGGILFATPFILILIIGIFKVVNGKIKNQDNYLYAVLLISASLPRLMLSASFWNVQIFWLLIAFIVTTLFQKKKH